MGDNNLDIYIRMITQQTGEKPEAVLAKLKDEIKDTDKVTKDKISTDRESDKITEKLTISHREQKKSLKELGREIPAVGQAFRAFLSPLATLIGGTIGVVGMFRKEINDTMQAMQDLDSGGRTQEQIKEIAASFDAARKSAAAFHDELEAARAGDSPANRMISEAKAKMRASDAEEDRKLKARGSSEIELATVAEHRAKRDAQFKIDSAALLGKESKEMEHQAKLKEEALAKATADLVRRKQQLELDKAEKAKLDDFIEKAQANKGFFGPAGTFIGTDSDYFQGLLRRQSELPNQINKNAASISYSEIYGLPSLAADATRAKSAAIGAGKGAANLGFEGGLDLKYPTVGGAGMISAAAAGADAINVGGKATAEQKIAINEAAKAFGLVGQNNKVILEMLGRMNGNQEAQLRALKTLEARVNRDSQHQ